MSKRHSTALDNCVIRDETMAALKPADAYGNPLPKRMGAHPFVGLAIQAGVPSRTVPEEFWGHATDLENHAQAVVHCPCGEVVIVELAVNLRPCPGCQRWFFYSGPDVLVLNTPSPHD
jgi:hypothetical protein